MEMKHKNSNIKCSVTQCKHNMVTENYCGLDCICVGTHESNPTVPECTNCDSFVKRSTQAKRPLRQHRQRKDLVSLFCGMRKNFPDFFVMLHKGKP